jgi:hypothetical protein
MGNSIKIQFVTKQYTIYNFQIKQLCVFISHKSTLAATSVFVVKAFQPLFILSLHGVHGAANFSIIIQKISNQQNNYELHLLLTLYALLISEQMK